MNIFFKITNWAKLFYFKIYCRTVVLKVERKKYYRLTSKRHCLHRGQFHDHWVENAARAELEQNGRRLSWSSRRRIRHSHRWSIMNMSDFTINNTHSRYLLSAVHTNCGLLFPQRHWLQQCAVRAKMRNGRLLREFIHLTNSILTCLILAWFY